MTEPARTAPGPTRLPVSLSAAGNPAQELDRVLLPWLRVATAGALDAEFDRLESPSSEGLHGLFEVELLTIRGIGGCPVLWNPLRRWLNRHMPAVFEGKVFSGTAGYNQFAAGRQGLFFGVRRRPGDPRHVIIDYNVSGTPRPLRALAADVRRLTNDTLLCRTIWRRRKGETVLLHFLLTARAAR